MHCKALPGRLISFFYPDHCVLCDTVMHYREDDLYICPVCQETLRLSADDATCAICGRHITEGEMLCEICQTHPHAFDKALTCLTYEGHVRESILRYKFHNRPDYARAFSAMMLRRFLPFAEAFACDMVVCAPLHKRALRKRGYNQSELLARPIAKQLSLPFIKDAFIKIKETPKQSTLQYSERQRNVADCFALSLHKSLLRGKTVLLIDDVLTTGATADALASLLKKAGAKTVIVLVIAGTEPDRPDKKMTPKDWENLVY